MARRVVGAVVLLLALAACGGDPKADPSPVPSPSTSPVSTTPSVPAMPDAAKENSKAGAIAFVRHYIDLVNYAQATGDVSALSAVEDPGCASCTNVKRAIEQTYGGGGSIEGGEWHPHMRIALRNSDGSWLVSGYIRVDPEQVRQSSTSPPSPRAGGSAIAHMTVRFSAAAWKVFAWSRES